MCLKWSGFKLRPTDTGGRLGQALSPHFGLHAGALGARRGVGPDRRLFAREGLGELRRQGLRGLQCGQQALSPFGPIHRAMLLPTARNGGHLTFLADLAGDELFRGRIGSKWVT